MISSDFQASPKPLPQSPLRSVRLAMATLLLLSLSACNSVAWLGVKLLVDKETLPEDRRLREISYVDDDPHPEKHAFDFFLPQGKGWPTLVYVHGGSWTEGDKDLKASGLEVYGNIGAYYAGQGIGTAVINYRLQPGVTWRDQVRDVARAVDRVRQTATEHGGDGDAIFISGHSAGAQLAAFAAVADWPLAELDDALTICGVVAISGAGYDLADQRTYELGADPEYYQAIFSGNDRGPEQATDHLPEADWQAKASVTEHLDATDPPFLVFYGGSEYPSLQHQARLLHEKLGNAEVSSQLEVVPRQSHKRIVVTFSQGKSTMTNHVVSFIEQQHRRCTG